MKCIPLFYISSIWLCGFFPFFFYRKTHTLITCFIRKLFLIHLCSVTRIFKLKADNRKSQTESAIYMMNVTARTTTLAPNMNENDDTKTNVHINAITTRRFCCCACRPQGPVVVLASHGLVDFDGISDFHCHFFFLLQGSYHITQIIGRLPNLMCFSLYIS